MGSFSIWHWVAVAGMVASVVALAVLLWLVLRTLVLRLLSLPRASSVDSPASTKSRLRKLDDLRAKGLITSDEYDRQRSMILQGV